VTPATRQKLRTSIAALATAFGVAATPAPAKAAAPELPQSPTLWKTESFDAVIQLQPCPETGVCGSLHWVNPSDTALFEKFGDRSGRSFGDDITKDDVKGLCGFSPKMQFNQVAPGQWQGKMDLRGMNMTVGVEATGVDDKTMHVKFSKGIFSQSETWRRVEAGDPRYPKCEKPKP
jgi:uncharacterized protein (DUF2147 family)